MLFKSHISFRVVDGNFNSDHGPTQETVDMYPDEDLAVSLNKRMLHDCLVPQLLHLTAIPFRPNVSASQVPYMALARGHRHVVLGFRALLRRFAA